MVTHNEQAPHIITEKFVIKFKTQDILFEIQSNNYHALGTGIYEKYFKKKVYVNLEVRIELY